MTSFVLKEVCSLPSFNDTRFIVDVIPKNASTGIALNSPVSIKFGRDIDPSTVTGAIIVTKISNGVRIPGTTTYQYKNAVWTPMSNFEPGESYQVTVMGDHGTNLPCIVDVMGIRMSVDTTFSFTVTKNTGLLAPVLVFPTDESIVVGDSIRFSFSTVEGATHYELKLSKSQSFETFEWSPMIYPNSLNTLDGIVSESTSGLSKDTEYFWHVRAWKDTVSGPWSEIKQFRLNAYDNEDADQYDDPIINDDITVVVSTNPDNLSYEILPDKIIIDFAEDINPNTVDVSKFYIVKTKTIK